MASVLIGSDAEHLIISNEAPDRGQDSLTAVLHLRGLEARRRIEPDSVQRSRDLAAFFRQLATEPHQQAARTWESLEPGLRITARPHGGCLTLTVELQYPRLDPGNDGWQATGDIRIEPGEQLTAIAADLEDLLER